jgi:cbb3-type cytochrome oxidase maturation protein
MNVLVYLVPVALMLGLTGLIAFLWSLKSGQYDDLDGAAFRVLTDDDLPPPRQCADIDLPATATEIRALTLTEGLRRSAR